MALHLLTCDEQRVWQDTTLHLLFHPPSALNPSISTFGRIFPTTSSLSLPRSSRHSPSVHNPTVLEREYNEGSEYLRRSSKCWCGSSWFFELERSSREFGEDAHIPQSLQRVVNERKWPPSSLEDFCEEILIWEDEIAHDGRGVEKRLNSLEFGVGRLEYN